MFFLDKSIFKRIFGTGIFLLIISLILNFQSSSSLAYKETPPDNIIFILDNSGSMQVRDEDNRFKIDSAKEVIKQNIDDPDLSRTSIGLIELGGKCVVDVLVEPSSGEANRKSIKSKLNSIRRDEYTSGATPIVKSIEQALRILETKSGTRKIILISDGLPNCDQPKACKIVEKWDKTLSERNIQFEMEIIGYGIENNNDEEFTCIDKLSDKFSYTKVNNKEKVGEAVKNAMRKSTNPINNKEEVGEAVKDAVVKPTNSPSPPPPPPPGGGNPEWVQIVLAVIPAITAIVLALLSRKK